MYRALPWIALAAWLAMSWLGQGRALAQGDVKEAKKLFQEGTAAVQKGADRLRDGKKEEALESYGVAAYKFLAAYKNAPNVLVLYNLGEVYWAREERVWARACYQRFLTDARDDTRERVQELVPEVEARMVQLGEQAEPVASKDPIDPVGVCYVARVIDVEPVDTQVPDKVEDKNDVITEPLPPPPPEKPGRGGGGYRVGFWASSAVTVGALAGATVTFLQVRGSLEDAKLDAIRDYQNSTGMALDVGDACRDADTRLANGDNAVQGVVDACDTGRSRARVSNVLQGVALVGLAASGYFFYKGYMQKRGPSEERAVTVIPVLSPESVGASMMLRF